MRRKLLTFFIICNLYSFGQQQNCFYEIYVNDGYTFHGSQSIRFTYEGLLIYNSSNKIGGNVKFIPLIKLNQSKCLELLNFVNSKKLINRQIKRNENSIKYLGAQSGVVISILDMNTNEYNYIYSRQSDEFDSDLDSLIILLKDIIPFRYKKRFDVKLYKPLSSDVPINNVFNNFNKVFRRRNYTSHAFPNTTSSTENTQHPTHTMIW